MGVVILWLWTTVIFKEAKMNRCSIYKNKMSNNNSIMLLLKIIVSKNMGKSANEH